MAKSEPGALEFRVLGPVQALRYGIAVPLGGPRQRGLLALLLLEPGRAVEADRLVDELWHGDPPDGASTSLRAYLSKLRTVLGAGAPVTRSAAGYSLDIRPDQVDAVRFERLTREGQDALARGAARGAAERLREALALWHGHAFAGVDPEGALRVEADRLDQLRLLALEERIEADLALGRSAALIDELERLVGQHPYRERLWRHLMLALYRAERQSDALATYRRAHTRLDEDLGLEPGEELQRLEQMILRHEVPRVGPSEQPHNLPAPITSFVGREAELADVERLLGEARLVTLTGVGGAGKTRLALEAAARAIPDSPDGVFFVDFSALAEPALVPGQVAATLDVRVQSDAPISELLAAQLRSTDLVLVLDNCEHLRDACAQLTKSLLASCPHVRILATSREPLGVAGEIDYPVPPLALPSNDADADELRSSEAVRLFLDRARAARPQLPTDDAALSTAARICRDLDGLPLALEFAAARAKAFSLEEIATRLGDRFRFLVSWRRLTAARHRTLKEAMDWSYELLSDDERDLLERVSVFAGGFTLGAAASVCLEGVDARAVELLGRLVDASLINADQRDAGMRYRLLETVRQYAAERLEEGGQAEAIRRRHAEWCVAVAEEAEPQLTGENQAWWFATLEAEHDNMRSALAYLATTEEGELQLRLTVALTRFWYVRGYLVEARRRLQNALAASDDQAPPLRRRALTAAASLALLQGDHVEATALAEDSLAVAHRTGEARLVANALSNLGAIALAAGDHARAAATLEEAVLLAREAGDYRIAALAINNLGDLALTTGDYDRARPLFEESLAFLQARRDTSNIARSLFNLGSVDLMVGRLDEARVRFRESLILSRSAGDKEDIAWCLEGIAGLAAADGYGERAAFLLGAAGALLEQMGAAFKPFERRLHEASVAQARALCGADGFALATRAGRDVPLDQALDLATAI